MCYLPHFRHYLRATTTIIPAHIRRYTSFKMPSQEFQVTVDGLSLRARIDSPDAVIGQSSLPWIVFSNSLLTNLHNWDQATALFQGRYNILRYDQRGHGGSDIPPASATTTIDRLTDDVAALLDHFGIKEILAFVGDSMGGATALNFAIRHATRIGAVVACDTIPQTAEAMKQTWADRIKTGAAQGMEPLADAVSYPSSFEPRSYNFAYCSFAEYRTLAATPSDCAPMVPRTVVLSQPRGSSPNPFNGSINSARRLCRLRRSAPRIRRAGRTGSSSSRQTHPAGGRIQGWPSARIHAWSCEPRRWSTLRRD